MTGANLQFWAAVLQLPNFVVVHVEDDSYQRCYRITVRPEQRIGVCPHCAKASEEVHQTRTREDIKDLPIGRYAVELKVRVEQFTCGPCECAFTPPVPFLAEGAHATERFLERAAELIRNSDIANVAKFYGLSEQTLGRWYYEYVERCKNSTSPALKPIRRIGIDELSLKKNIDSGSP
jgi:transposase